ncbi:oligosaccharide flippase family protein [Flavobacterium agricola]|uniref:Oligosaccharide flippase family protein n=1 Tax=Flavobacterium agricola TaxID=2870839 RepID=A0ABY6LX14_9FLAO|nr:oligosaccharide flippase family protein [Flavobacterium agricola]UYW00888.1 oligosaccharide flippase family protein [Flavobacterium agricola]
MSLYTKLFKQTLVYGLAAVFPKIIGFIMVRYYINWMPENAYGSYSLIFSWLMFLNVVLSFGMETAFFRFYNKYEDKKQVISNALYIILGICLVFCIPAFVFIKPISNYFITDPVVTAFIIAILVLDALAVVPFALLRAKQKSGVYTGIKITNVLLYSGFTIVFLYVLPQFFPKSRLFIQNFEVGYAYLANLIASLVCLLLVAKTYRYLRVAFNWHLAKEMLIYAYPVMIGGLAFAINESFDKIILDWMLPKDVGIIEVARYAAIYKLGLFMVLFRMAYTLGIEPFFFNYAKNEDAPIKYATVTKYFVLFGSLVMLVIVVCADILKIIMIPKQAYWSAMEIVPYIILANLMLGIYTNLSVWYKIQDKTKVGMYISILGAIGTFAFNFLLIPHFGILGCAMATLLVYAFMMYTSYLLGQKNYPIPYDKKAISLYLGSSTLLSFVYFYQFRENYIIGFIFVVILVAIIGWNERPLLKQLLSLKKG